MLSKFLIWELLQNKKTIGYFQTALTFFNISLKPSKAGFNQAILGNRAKEIAWMIYSGPNV